MAKKFIPLISSLFIVGGVVLYHLGFLSPSFFTSEYTVLEHNTFRDGRAVCLPQKSGAARIPSCVLGFESDTGEHYELLEIGRVGPEGTIKHGMRYRFKGDVVKSRNTSLFTENGFIIGRLEGGRNE